MTDERAEEILDELRNISGNVRELCVTVKTQGRELEKQSEEDGKLHERISKNQAKIQDKINRLIYAALAGAIAISGFLVKEVFFQ